MITPNVERFSAVTRLEVEVRKMTILWNMLEMAETTSPDPDPDRRRKLDRMQFVLSTYEASLAKIHSSGYSEEVQIEKAMVELEILDSQLPLWNKEWMRARTYALPEIYQLNR